MKAGKIQESILDRAVLKQLKHRRDEVIVRPAAGLDCAAACLPEKTIYVSHMNTVSGDAYECGRMAVMRAASGLWAKGADIFGIHVSIMMPKLAEEQELRRLIADIEQSCDKYHIEILGGHTEVSEAAAQFIVTVCAEGFLKEGMEEAKKRLRGKARPGDDIVMTGYAGLFGTAAAARRAERILCKKYNPDFIENAQSFFDIGNIKETAGVLNDFDVSAVHDVASSGIFGALWELSKASGHGFSIDLKKILLRQETVEICDFFDLNPYRLESGGSLLIAVSHGEQLVLALKKKGIAAAVIGEITADKNKTVVNDDESGCMEPPRGSELSKIEWRKV